jgi:hypothetical protein
MEVNMAERITRLVALQTKIRRQIIDAECLMEALEDYCRENPDEEPCAANDPSWPLQVAAQRNELRAMLDAIGERIAANKPSEMTESAGDRSRRQ